MSPGPRKVEYRHSDNQRVSTETSQSPLLSLIANTSSPNSPVPTLTGRRKGECKVTDLVSMTGVNCVPSDPFSYIDTRVLGLLYYPYHKQTLGVHPLRKVRKHRREQVHSLNDDTDTDYFRPGPWSHIDSRRIQVRFTVGPGGCPVTTPVGAETEGRTEDVVQRRLVRRKL